MTGSDRWDQIVRLVDQRGFAPVSELSQRLAVSEVTIRRDLQALHDQGRVMRTYGGAAAVQLAAASGAMEPEPAAESFLGGRFDALIATPVTPNLERVLLDRAMQERVPIIAESLGMAGAQTVVAVDNFAAGQDLGCWAGHYLRQHMDGGATVLDLTHRLSNTHQRSLGFVAGLRDVLPEARVALSIDAQARYDTAYQLTCDALAVHPSINLIFAINDTTAVGAMAACQDMGVSSSALLVVTFGLEGDTMKDALMAQEFCKAGLAMFPEIVAPVCVEAALHAIAGQPLPQQLVTPHAILTAETLDQFYQRADQGWQIRWQAVQQRLSIPLPVDGLAAQRQPATPQRIAFVKSFSEHEWYRNLAAAMADYAAARGIDLAVADAAQSLRDEVELRKRAIARRAARLVQPGDVVLVDGGQVTAFLSEELRHSGEITVITNSTAVFDALRQCPHVTLLSTGGWLRNGAEALTGPTAEATLRDLRADKLFLATTGISLDFGLSHPDQAEVAVKKAMIQAAREIILLADHSKFDADSVVQIAAIDAVDKLVTDSALPASVRLELSKRGIEIILAET
jgi:DeoR/GlpR family transcriptional regulator of sugar metabolism